MIPDVPDVFSMDSLRFRLGSVPFFLMYMRDGVEPGLVQLGGKGVLHTAIVQYEEVTGYTGIDGMAECNKSLSHPCLLLHTL